MANIPPAVGPEPTSFGELFGLMPDVYNGEYTAYLQEYAVEDNITGNAIMLNTITRFPTSQVPAIFAYLDADGLIRTVHHLHRVEVPLGRPSPWADAIIGFSGDIHLTQIAYVRVSVDDFFDNTEEVVVPTTATLGAALTGLADGNLYCGPYAAADPDTEAIRSRRAVPVPYPYVTLLHGRALTPREAWEQVGAQIMLDQREADCAVFLRFLQAASTHTRPRQGQRGVPQPPANIQREALIQPRGDAVLLEHIGRRLRVLLPVTVAPAAGLGPQFAQATDALRVALLEDREQNRAALVEEREQDRAERAVAGEIEAAATSFSAVFPAVATGIHRLCAVGGDDEQLPQFWKYFAAAKGKKAQSMASLEQLLTQRTNELDSAGILPVITAQLFNNIANFHIGSSDLSTITKGVSPFLMCPLGYHKAVAEQEAAQEYLMIHNDAGNPSLAEVRTLITPTYNLPDSIHQLVEFIGAYSIIWDVLVGPENPISRAVRDHHMYWQRFVASIKADLPSMKSQGHVMIGTLRAMQLEILGFVNRRLYSDADLAPPSLAHIETAIARGLYNLPSLPERYWSTPAATPQLTSGASGQPATNPPNTTTPRTTSGTPIDAPATHLVPAWREAFTNSQKTVQQLKMLPMSKRPKIGKTFVCLAYHLRGTCYDNCRFSQTHRELTDTEKQKVQKLIDNEL